MAYDENNTFAQILRGDLSCEKVYESAHALAFKSLSPQEPVHVVVIPKGAYESFHDFSARASAEEIAEFFRATGGVAHLLGVVGKGYRMVMNVGAYAHQDPHHFHVHLLGGRPLLPLPAPHFDDVLILFPGEGEPTHEQIQAFGEAVGLEPYDAGLKVRTALPLVLQEAAPTKNEELAGRLAGAGFDVG